MLYFLYGESGYSDLASFLKESGEKDTPFADRLVVRLKATPHLSERSGADRPSTAISCWPRISFPALMTSGSRAGGPSLIPLPRALTTVFATATMANHLYSAGTMCQGAAAVEVCANMSSSVAGGEFG
jgi:hypothetical protein